MNRSQVSKLNIAEHLLCASLSEADHRNLRTAISELSFMNDRLKRHCCCSHEVTINHFPRPSHCKCPCLYYSDDFPI